MPFTRLTWQKSQWWSMVNETNLMYCVMCPDQLFRWWLAYYQWNYRPIVCDEKPRCLRKMLFVFVCKSIRDDYSRVWTSRGGWQSAQAGCHYNVLIYRGHLWPTALTSWLCIVLFGCGMTSNDSPTEPLCRYYSFCPNFPTTPKHFLIHCRLLFFCSRFVDSNLEKKAPSTM